MRRFYIFFMSVIPITYLFGQTNPEDIIIRYNSDGSKDVINKKDLVSDPDSVDAMLFQDVEKMYLLKIDSLELLNKIAGKWTFRSAQRVNGMDFSSSNASSYEFRRNGSFASIDGGEKLEGKWNVEEGGDAVIRLAYDKPKVIIKDKNILKQLDKETLKSVTFSSEIISLVTITSTSMIVRSSTIIKDSQDTGNFFYRIVLLNYEKN
jgi:hypothetical protein